MKKHTTRPDSATAAAETAPHLFDNWFDPIEFGVRSRVRDFIETMMEEELEAVLSRPRYGRVAPTASKEAGSAEAAATGHRHGHRSRTLLGTFGPVEVAMPRARLNAPDGGTTEWKSTALKAYQRRTIAADAVIAATYLAGTNTRRVRRALTALFGGAVSKDTVSRTWRKVKTDWDAWNTRSLADEPIVRSSTVRWFAFGSTAKPLRFRCLSSWGCAPTDRKFCSRSRTWAVKAPRPGAVCLTISPGAVCSGRSFSSSMARRGSTAPSPRCGTACRSNAAPYTSTGICSRTRRNVCTRKSPPTTTI